MYEWSQPVIEAAEKKGMKVDRVDREAANKAEVASRIEKTNPSFIFLNGHGNSACFYGYNSQPLIGLDEATLLANRVVFARACDCLGVLGKGAVSHHACKSFIGYEFEFINVRQTNIELKPMEDGLSRPIWESSNAVPLSLVKGSTVTESVEASHKRTTKELSRFLYSEEPGSREVLKALIMNDEGLGYHGDGSARI